MTLKTCLNGWVFSLLCLGILWVPSYASEPTLVYLVRHAEKVDSSRDADLSERGLQRAEKLASFFEKIQLDGLYASQYQRTRKTLVPVSQQKQLDIEVVPAEDPEELVQKVRATAGRTLLIAGHSNTIPDLIQRLGGPTLTISDEDYRNLFLLVLTENNATLQTFRLEP